MLGFGIINFLIEICWGVAFIFLWKFFSNLCKQSGMVTHNHIFWSNVAIAFIMFLYFMACLVFDFFCPVLSFRYERRETRTDWVDLFYHVYYLRFLLDFVSCTMILYMLYRFGERQAKVNQREGDKGELHSMEPRSHIPSFENEESSAHGRSTALQRDDSFSMPTRLQSHSKEDDLEEEQKSDPQDVQVRLLGHELMNAKQDSSISFQIHSQNDSGYI